LASSLADIKVERKISQGFYSVKELRGIEYVGYIIEKEVLIRGTEKWKKIDEYRIIGADVDTYLDSRVIYGEMYRYRIKSVIRSTKKEVTVHTLTGKKRIGARKSNKFCQN
jgi:hypothetical protein